MEELFYLTTGYEPFPLSINALRAYVHIGNEREILELISSMSVDYPDPDIAEIGFITVWSALVNLKPPQ